MIGEVVKVMSMSSVLKASLFAIALVAAFSSLLAVSEIDTADAEVESGIEFNEGALRYKTISIDTVEITGPVDVNIADLSIPSLVSHDGTKYKVTSIGSSAFSGCSGLTSVTIGNSVTSIGNYAFEGCAALTSVTIPDSVTSIGYSAFQGCAGLTSVTIGNSVTSIGDYAFYGCAGLTSLTMPIDIKVTKYTFYDCTNLTSVVLTKGQTGVGASYSSGYYDDYRYTPWYQSRSNEISVTIEEGVGSIGERAFSYCTELTSVTIGNSVTSIGYSAFYNCTRLTSLTIPSSVTYISDYAFYNCTGLTSLTIPSSVTSIGNLAFNGLTFVAEDGTTVLEHTVENLRSYRFEGTYERMVRITYTVTYDVDGGSVPEPIQSPLSEGRSFVVAAYDGTKAGHTFAGWSEGDNVYKTGDEYTVGDSDVVLTAIWDINQYTIVFDANGATGEVPATITKDYNSVVTLPDVGDLAKTGYTFAGWSLTEGGEVYEAGYEYTVEDSDITVTAQWTINKYNLSFDANGATGKVPETITAEYDSVVTLPDVGDLAKTGYTFGGWMSDDKNIFRPGGTFTIGDMDVTLTAIWYVDLVADGTVEVEHSSFSFSQVDVETGKEYSFRLDNGVMARFNGSDVTGDVTFTAVQWEGDFHVEGAAVYSIDMVGSGSVNILIPVGEFGSPVVHHLRADGTDEILTRTIVEIDGVEYASFDADNFSFFYMVEGTPAEGGPMDTMLIAGAVAAVLVVVLVAFWAYRRKNAS